MVLGGFQGETTVDYQEVDGDVVRLVMIPDVSWIEYPFSPAGTVPVIPGQPITMYLYVPQVGVTYVLIRDWDEDPDHEGKGFLAALWFGPEPPVPAWDWPPTTLNTLPEFTLTWGDGESCSCVETSCGALGPNLLTIGVGGGSPVVVPPGTEVTLPEGYLVRNGAESVRHYWGAPTCPDESDAWYSGFIIRSP